MLAMEMGNVIDILFMGSGIYLIYSAFMAKKNGTITANVMLGKGMDEKSIKDKTGFIEYMYKKILIAGILVILAGAINFINDCFFFSNIATAVASAVIIVAIVLYVTAYKKGQKAFVELQKEQKLKDKV